MKYLLDTCVISEFIKSSPNQNVIKWFKEQNNESLYLSVMTFGEIQHGISRLSDCKKKESLSEWLCNLEHSFNGRIIDIDIKLASYWGNLQGNLSIKGNKMPVIDSLLAAAALNFDMTLVTRNVKDVEKSGVNLINPFEYII